MAEQLFVGVGKPTREARIPEKSTLKTWAEKTFTFGGAEEQWRKTHEKEIAEMTAINASLSDEDRAKAMENLDKRIKSAAQLKVIGNYTALTAVTAAVVGEGALLLVPGLAEKAEGFTINGKPVLKPFGWSARMVRQGLREMIDKNDLVKKMRSNKGSREKLKAMDRVILHTDALSGAIKLPELDKLDSMNPVTAQLVQDALQPGLFSRSRLDDSLAETLVRNFLYKAKDANRWVPIVVSPVDDRNIIRNEERGMGHLLKEGFVTMSKLDNGMQIYSPTKKMIDFVLETIAHR